MNRISLKNERPTEGLCAFYSYKLPVHGIGNVPGFIAIANLINNSALGGWRTKLYSSLDMAVIDATRLARDMRLKFGVLQIPMGGAKADTLIDAPSLRSDQNAELCDNFGEVLMLLRQREGIRYVTGKDIGRTDDDIARVAKTAPGLAAVGSPSSPTAHGIFRIIHAFFPSGGSVAIEGLGAVGMTLARILVLGGYRVVGFDSDRAKCEEAKRFGVVIESDILKQNVDVFSGCAGSFGFNPRTIPLIKPKYLIGSANIELEDPERDSLALHKAGKILIPGFGGNGAGAASIINSFVTDPVDLDDVLDNLERFALEIVAESLRTGRTTYHVAKERAEANIRSMEKRYQKIAVVV